MQKYSYMALENHCQPGTSRKAHNQVWEMSGKPEMQRYVSAASTQGAVRDRRLMIGGVIREGGAELTDDIVEEVDESEGGRVDCK